MQNKEKKRYNRTYRFIFRAKDVATAIFHCQACAYRVTCLTDSPVTLICFIGVIRHDHSAPEELQPGWFTELLLSLGISLGKVAASSPGIVGNKRLSKSETAGFLKECRRVGLIGQCRRSNAP